MRERYYSRMNISDRLDIAMHRAGYHTQTALARASGVSQPSINRILKTPGTVGPDSDTIKKLAAACGVSFEWLLNGADTVTNSPPAILPLVHVTIEELEMLTILRMSNQNDKALIADLFKVIAEHHTPPDTESLSPD